MVASKPAARGTPDTSSGQIVGVGREVKKRAVWKQATEASVINGSVWGAYNRWNRGGVSRSRLTGVLSSFISSSATDVAASRRSSQGDRALGSAE